MPYNIKLTTNDGGECTGKMSRRQPEQVNGFVPLATETGERLYLLMNKRMKINRVGKIHHP